jgi:hypothetical protein
MPASVAIAIGVARCEGTPTASSCSASTAAQDRNVVRTTSITPVSSGTVSIATPATTQPAVPAEATTVRRHTSMKRLRTSDGPEGVPARR